MRWVGERRLKHTPAQVIGMPTRCERAKVGRRGRPSAAEIALLHEPAIAAAVLLTAKGRKGREALLLLLLLLLLLRVKAGQVGTAVAGRAAKGRVRAVRRAESLMLLLLLLTLLVGCPHRHDGWVLEAVVCGSGAKVNGKRSPAQTGKKTHRRRC